jgi:hypothetical protein
MKNTLKIFALLFILISNSCKAQQMVQTTRDVYKLKTNEQQFANRPLKDLLKENELPRGRASRNSID